MLIFHDYGLNFLNFTSAGMDFISGVKEEQNSPCLQGAYNPSSLKYNLLHSTNSYTKIPLWPDTLTHGYKHQVSSLKELTM